MWRGHWLDAAAAELAIRGSAVKRRHLSDNAQRLVWRRRWRRESTAGAGERSRHRPRQAACASEPPHCVWEDRDRVAAPQLAAEVQLPGPGEEGKKAVSMTDGTAGGLGAAALTGGALIMQGGVEMAQVEPACRRSKADDMTGGTTGMGPTARRLRRSICRTAGVKRSWILDEQRPQR